MNILIIRLSSLGDIIHTFPMISDIKKNFPDAQIDWLVDNSFQDLVAINPNIHEVINIPLRSWSKHKLSFIHNFRQWKKEIQSKFESILADCLCFVKMLQVAKFDEHCFYLQSIFQVCSQIFW